MNKNIINYLYEDYAVGKRIVNEEEEYDCIDKKLDTLYYNDLDHLFKCDLTTKIDIDNQEIEHTFKIKDNYKNLSLNNQEKKYIDEDDNWGLPIEKQFSMGYNLTDWLIDKLSYENMDDYTCDYISDLIDSDYEIIDRDTEELKLFIYYNDNPKMNVFYNREENEKLYNYICSRVG